MTRPERVRQRVQRLLAKAVVPPAKGVIPLAPGHFILERARRGASKSKSVLRKKLRQKK